MLTRTFSPKGFAAGLAAVLAALPMLAAPPVSAAQISDKTMGDFTAYPVINTSAVPPLTMFVMSRDEQLYIKAYTDYTDLDGDGIVDTTYNNNFNYSGYFDPNVCYTYDTTISVNSQSGAFTASGAATNHQCSGQWSGNFLNWAAMSRIDVLRYVLYGGYRAVDSTTQTVLERSFIPSDLHAWVKVYNNADVNLYTPYSTYPISMCNVSIADSTTTLSNNSPPLLRVAKGAYTEWGSTAREQCLWRETITAKWSGADINPGDYASRSNDKLDELNVRVQVCNASGTRESFCQAYVDGSGVTHYKPVGLLQKYGEKQQMRFGLISGSYSAPRTGGILRRNINFIANNGGDATCANSKNEINLQTGQFCNQSSGNEGIVNTLNRFHIVGWDANSDVYTDCPTYGILQRDVQGANGHLLDPDGSGGYTTAYKCKDSGNPLAEMYAEALRYIVGNGATPTSSYNPSESSLSDLSNRPATVPSMTGLPNATWKDPYKTASNPDGAPYCANCNIVVLTTGLNSFDSDGIGTVPNLNLQADAATTLVGNNEQLNTKTSTGAPPQWLLGRVGPLTSTTYQDTCLPQTVTDLAQAHGICPDIPSLEGGYQLAGLAYEAWTSDLRPDLSGTQKVQTYAIALAETLPTFQIPVSTGGGNYDLITITPACQANNNGGATLGSTTGWRSCYLGNLVIGQKVSTTLSQSDWLKIVNNQSPSSPGTCDATTTNKSTSCRVFGLPTTSDSHGPTSGSFEIVWEDSQWGNDHDQDVTELLSFCRGAMCRYDGNNDGTPDICEGTPSNACNASNIQDSQILVRTEALVAFAGNALQIGYTTAGAFNAGNGQAASGAKFTVLRPGNTNGSLLFGSYGGARNWTPPSVEKYTTGPAEQRALENPLFFAAKYGGFNDKDGNNLPTYSDPSEWDITNNFTGQKGADGIPDNYFLVRNPAQLYARLSQVFDSILKRAGSGTAAAVVSNSARGIGLTYQALYLPERKDAAGRVVSWIGSLNGIWTDTFGLLREDGNANAVLDDYDTDPAIAFFYDTVDRRTKFKRFTLTASEQQDPSTFNPETSPNYTVHELDELRTVWSAQKQLWSNSSTFAGQRSTYQAGITGTGPSRYIFTWIDANHNGVVDSGEQQPFVWSGATAGPGFWGSKTTTKTGKTTTTTYTGNFEFLNTDDPGDGTSGEAENIVNWIRGYEVSGLRSRVIDYDDNGTLRTMRLGDIVNSTPVVVSAPSEAFDLLYGDDTYGAFRNAYRNRRQVVYVGANDGMLHAFNGGFFNARQQKIGTQPPKDANGNFVPVQPTPNGGPQPADPTAQPLGSELWAYVPGNLLPHLRWLTRTDYTHVFYVDGNPVVTDARVFDTGSCTPTDDPCVDSAGHVDGWGTIMIVPFRLGGGPINQPVADNGSSGCDPTNPVIGTGKCVTKASYSGFAVLDITNPEKAPTLLAEIMAPGNTYAASMPAIAVVHPTVQQGQIITGGTSGGSVGKFFLFVGSGPTDNGGIGSQGGRAASTVGMKVAVYDLATLAGASHSITPVRTFDFTDVGATGLGQKSFAGDLLASDYDLNYAAESMYFGSVRDQRPAGNTDANEFSGSLYKIGINEDANPANWTANLVYNVDRPITAHPTIGRNNRGAPMVFFGTGRIFTKYDMATKGQQKIVGLIDTSLLPNADVQHKALPLATSDLVDVTSLNVTTAGALTGSGIPTGVSTFSQLLNSFDTASQLGWFMNLAAPSPATPTTAPDGTTVGAAERVIASQALIGGVLLTTTYVPGTDTCTDVGSGFLYGQNYKTGTADPTLQATFGTASDGTVKRAIALGAGLPAAPSLHVGEGTGAREVTACVQTSTGAIICKKILTLQSVQPGEVSWREMTDK
ncbi:PilC domain-containing protein [Mizugakiibacter sediminis]|uniref:PilC domain-containing protein n=1 Tax=Mizugakiibacter sediminis TaxID=1475481 RepID=A0A0K8QR69_9GAMM|nr:PilC/PilY family type IV pilus protein [Mizugakiibacter sediminis]GAP67395.1 PilC domain-containing protein [Mizugakiibacter sediminis]